MRPLRTGILMILLIAVSLLGGYASTPDIELSHAAYVDTIGYDGTAQFSVTVKNNQLKDDTLYLKPASLLWGDISFDDYILAIRAGRSEKVNVKITPPGNVRVGTYDIGITATSTTDNSVKAQDTLRLLITSERPDVEAVIDLPSKTAPKEITANIILKNTGSSEIAELAGKLESGIFEPPAEFEIGALEAKETKLVASLKLVVSPNTKAKTYPVKLTVYQKSQKLNDFIKYIEILEKENVITDSKASGNFLYSVYTVNIRNTGNQQATGEWKAEFPGLRKYFVFSSPKAVVRGNEFIWAYTLDPGASISITYGENYLALIAVIVALVILISFLSWKLRAPFVIKKEAVAGAHEGGKAIKVKLLIKNRSLTEQKNVIVEDSVPTPLRLVKEFGTAEPTVIKKEAGKVLMSWKFDMLAAGEERIIAYHVKSALGIVGGITLPTAKLKCKIKDKQMHIYSNRISLQGRIEVVEIEDKPED